ncbi:MAG: hypothetical protein WC997_18140 [Porticoccaceae bacterium]
MRTQKIAIVARRDIERDYGFRGTEAIIDHPKHGRLLLCDGFGGKDTLAGGTVRWTHGMAVKLEDDDTFDALDSTEWSVGTTLMQAVKGGYDDARPILDWDGLTIARVAAAAGL